jgi:hypothetical protein
MKHSSMCLKDHYTESDLQVTSRPLIHLKARGKTLKRSPCSLEASTQTSRHERLHHLHEMACDTRTLADRTAGMPLPEEPYDTQSGVPLPKGRCNAFKKSMIHDNRFELQFTSHFAAGRVLHRMPCRGIQRYQLYLFHSVSFSCQEGSTLDPPGLTPNVRYAGIPDGRRERRIDLAHAWAELVNTLAPINVVFRTTLGKRNRPQGGTRSPTGSSDVASEARRMAVFETDPSAGSPTETLLRLVLPLRDQV